MSKPSMQTSSALASQPLNRLNPLCALQYRPAEIGAARVRASEIGVAEVSAGEVRLQQARAE